MIKKLVLTIAIGDSYKEIEKITIPIIKKYADKINADFLVIDENYNYNNPKWNKFKINELLFKYNRIIYFDVDLIIREDCPNLFEIVPEHKLGMFNQSRYSPNPDLLINASQIYNEPIKKPKNELWNTGVIVASRKHSNLFKFISNIDIIDDDQPYLNLRITNDEIDMFDLTYKFNRMEFVDSYIGISRLDSYIIHYTGAPYELMLDVINKDLNKWKLDSPEYSYKRNIMISISGGMGDQLCSEPAIRWGIENEYPDAQFHIISHFPQLFNHLPAKSYSYSDWNGINDSILHLRTCPDFGEAGHPFSHVLFHPTDFATMSMFRKTIPHIDKTIKVILNENAVLSMNKIIKDSTKPNILIHAGKWWPTKTFPKYWWQEVVNKLSEELTPILIGKTLSENQGFVPIECPENGIDLRDLITLDEMIALISMVDVTLTNDSSPVHFSGAFDNWLVVIPTCKHPDHILPYRNGSQYYKTKTLYKKLLIDDLETRYTEIEPQTIDTMPFNKNIEEYLPDIDYLIREILDIYKQI